MRNKINIIFSYKVIIILFLLCFGQNLYSIDTTNDLDQYINEVNNLLKRFNEINEKYETNIKKSLTTEILKDEIEKRFDIKKENLELREKSFESKSSTVNLFLMTITIILAILVMFVTIYGIIIPYGINHNKKLSKDVENIKLREKNLFNELNKIMNMSDETKIMNKNTRKKINDRNNNKK